MPFELRFWGTRGSIPTPGGATVRYGGNTPCLELRTPSGGLVVLDAGTGIRELGDALIARMNGRPIVADLFLSHPHWDHVQGLPFFAPLFRDGTRLAIWGTGDWIARLEQVMRDQMDRTVFPVTFDELPASIAFRTMDGPGREAADYTVATLPVRHPGGALAYRFAARETPDQPALVYVSDNELGTAADRTDEEREAYARLVDFARGARVLVHDATYTDAEYQRHRGWGHSTDLDALALALDAAAERLVLFHHKPGRHDDEIDRCVERCRAKVNACGGRLDVLAAHEGLALTL
jgi:phosphoribosyl 1,2-cyclic phosphodiesterase